MNRRDILKLFPILGAAATATAVGVSASEPEQATGEWFLHGSPICPECNRVMDVSRERSRNGTVLFTHPEGYTMWRNAKAVEVRWACKNAGKTFAYPKTKLAVFKETS